MSQIIHILKPDKPLFFKPKAVPREKPHPIQDRWPQTLFNTMEDDPSLIRYLDVIHDAYVHNFTKVIQSVNDVRGANVDQLLPKFRHQNIREILEPAAQETMALAEAFQREAQQALETFQASILKLTAATEHPHDSVASLRQVMVDTETRRSLEKLTKDELNELLDQPADTFDLRLLHACLSDPNPIDCLVRPNRLLEVQRKLAFEVDPSLREGEELAIARVEATRKRCVNLNGVRASMLQHAGLEDPVTTETYFSVFKPRTELEQSYANKKIQEENKQRLLRERKEEFEAQAGPGG